MCRVSVRLQGCRAWLFVVPFFTAVVRAPRFKGLGFRAFRV